MSALTLVLSAAFMYLNPQLPETSSFSQVTLKAPLRIYSADGLLIQEFGERLTPITYDEIPPLFIRALLDTFGTHPLVPGYLDIQRLYVVLESIESDIGPESSLACRTILLRGLGVGVFLTALEQ